MNTKPLFKEFDLNPYFSPNFVFFNPMNFGANFITNFNKADLPIYNEAIRLHGLQFVLLVTDDATDCNGNPVSSCFALRKIHSEIKIPVLKLFDTVSALKKEQVRIDAMDKAAEKVSEAEAAYQRKLEELKDAEQAVLLAKMDLALKITDVVFPR